VGAGLLLPALTPAVLLFEQQEMLEDGRRGLGVAGGPVAALHQHNPGSLGIALE
jgi:hypothetical protein